MINQLIEMKGLKSIFTVMEKSLDRFSEIVGLKEEERNCWAEQWYLFNPHKKENKRSHLPFYHQRNSLQKIGINYMHAVIL